MWCAFFVFFATTGPARPRPPVLHRYDVYKPTEDVYIHDIHVKNGFLTHKAGPIADGE